MIEIAVTNKVLSLAVSEKVADPANGAVDIFIGAVRNQTDGRKVLRLEFEVYQGMAEKELRKIADTMVSRWPIRDVLIYHRVGTVEVGEKVVIIAVGAERRDAAFLACRYAIDTLKQTVPIWKKEIFADGEEWVQPHP